MGMKGRDAMRAAFGLLTLVIVLAVVLSLAKRQMQATAVLAPAPGASASAAAMPKPEAVGREVQNALDAAAAQRASEPLP
jgi:hypothetical protein